MTLDLLLALGILRRPRPNCGLPVRPSDLAKFASRSGSP
jgi:hypothetical protein